MRKLALLLLILLLGLVACSSDDGDKKADSKVGGTDAGAGDTAKSCGATALLPADNAVKDFTQDGAAKTASDLTALTDLINGGAEKYTESGKFVCMALVTYKSATESHTLELWLFDQTDSDGATTAYTNTENPDDKPLSPMIGDDARGHENPVAGIYQADMRKGQYLARVTAKPAAGQADAEALLTALASAIQ